MSLSQNPEQIVVEKETYEEIHHALNQLSAREGMYVRYRFGFEDDTEHTLLETAGTSICQKAVPKEGSALLWNPPTKGNACFPLDTPPVRTVAIQPAPAQ